MMICTNKVVFLLVTRKADHRLDRHVSHCCINMDHILNMEDTDAPRRVCSASAPIGRVADPV